MLAQILSLLAEATPSGGGTPPAGQGGNPADLTLTFLPILAIGVLFYFLMLRPMRKQEQERKNMASNLKKNDEVLTAAGIYGTVVSVSDTKDEVTVKVDDGTRLRMIKSSIVRNITREEEAGKAKEQTGAK